MISRIRLFAVKSVPYFIALTTVDFAMREICVFYAVFILDHQQFVGSNFGCDICNGVVFDQSTSVDHDYSLTCPFNVDQIVRGQNHGDVALFVDSFDVIEDIFS